MRPSAPGGAIRAARWVPEWQVQLEPLPAACGGVAGGRWACALAPAHLVQPHRVLEPSRDDVAPVREEERLVGGELPHHGGNQYISLAAWPGRSLNHEAVSVVATGGRHECGLDATG